MFWEEVYLGLFASSIYFSAYFRAFSFFAIEFLLNKLCISWSICSSSHSLSRGHLRRVVFRDRSECLNSSVKARYSYWKQSSLIAISFSQKRGPRFLFRSKSRALGLALLFRRNSCYLEAILESDCFEKKHLLFAGKNIVTAKKFKF